MLWVLVSCSQATEEPIQENSQPVNSLENYKFWGEAHNALLEATINHYNAPTRVIGDEDARPNYDELNSLQIQYA